jgi:hypothetical protein
MRQLHMQLMPQPGRGSVIPDRREQPVSRFPVPPKAVESKNREVICPQDGHLVILRGGHRPVGQQQSQLGCSPAQEHR